MSSKLTKRVKLPKEEENGNEPKGQDPKDESKVTPASRNPGIASYIKIKKKQSRGSKRKLKNM
jgi:hypothetical protein